MHSFINYPDSYIYIFMKNYNNINRILKDSIVYYENYKEKDFVVSPSLPILYFGDLNAYLKSDFIVEMDDPLFEFALSIYLNSNQAVAKLILNYHFRLS